MYTQSQAGSTVFLGLFGCGRGWVPVSEYRSKIFIINDINKIMVTYSRILPSSLLQKTQAVDNFGTCLIIREQGTGNREQGIGIRD
jgi:hypothetical protein